MLFGNKNDFANEAMVEPDLVPPSSPWGRLCVWVASNRIGNYEDPYCGLHPCCAGFVEACENLNALWEDEFASMSDLEIWNFLDGILYGYHGHVELDDQRSLDEIRRDAARYSKFNFLTNWGEMFDGGGKSFLLRQPHGTLKILNYDYDRNVVNSYVCSEFSFRRATKGLVDWYENQRMLLDSENVPHYD